MRWNEYYKLSNKRNCGKKLVFNSFAEASSFNKRSRRFLKGNQKNEEMHVYRCNACRQWHIGHYPGRHKDD